MKKSNRITIRVILLIVISVSLFFSSCHIPSGDNNQSADSTDQSTLRLVAANKDDCIWINYRWYCVYGDVPDYKPSYWNDGTSLNPLNSACRTKQCMNPCYNYACNVDGEKYPEHAYAAPGGESYHNSKSSMIWACQRDGLILYSYSTPPPFYKGTIAVALLMASNNDYHFIRRDSNGYWSHKDGFKPVTNKDSEGGRDFRDGYGRGKLITNPREADWGEFDFVCYFLAYTHEEQGEGKANITS